MSVIKGLYQIIEDRKKNPQEGSYTAYLFDKGLDKILKKIGEETAETIIAAKNTDNSELINEICDLTYHILVLLAEKGINIDDVEAVLEERRQKTGNLKVIKQVDKNS